MAVSSPTAWLDVFNNSGTLEKSAGTVASVVSATCNNVPGAEINVLSGGITLANDGNNTGGTFDVAGGTVLDLPGGGTNTFTGTYTGSGGGTVLMGKRLAQCNR